MKAGLFFFYGLKNSGDMAINLGAINALSNIPSINHINVMSRYGSKSKHYIDTNKFIKEHENFFKDISLYPGPFDFDRKKGFWKSLLEHILAFKNYRKSVKNKSLQSFIEDSDVLFFNGGNLMRFNSIHDLFRLWALFLPVKIAKKHKKKVFLLPHSTNKMNRFERLVMRKYLKNFEILYSREILSYKMFSNMLKSHTNSVESQIDMCFYLNINQLKNRKKSNDIKKIAITVRGSKIGDLGKLTGSQIEKLNYYLNESIRFIRESNQNIKLFIVCQTITDYEYSKDILNIYQESFETEFIEEYNTFKLLDIYQNVDIVIGMRLHSLILAASVGTPILGIFSQEWGIKNPGTFQTLGLKYLLIEKDYSIDYIHNTIHHNYSNQDRVKNNILKKQKALIESIEFNM